jgi:hypothetical protein
LCVLMREPRVRRSLCCCAASMACVPRSFQRQGKEELVSVAGSDIED